MKAYEVIEKFGWTQGEEARDDAGNRVVYYSPNATCFCIQGAIRKSVDPDGTKSSFDEHGRLFREANDKVQAVLDKRYEDNIDLGTTWAWNDHRGRTKEEVIAILREADV